MSKFSQENMEGCIAQDMCKPHLGFLFVSIFTESMSDHDLKTMHLHLNYFNI